MKLHILRAGTLAFAIAALATPSFAQGQGSAKPDSTAENPSTKTGGVNQDKTPKAGSGMNTNTGAANGATRTSPTGAGTPEKAMEDKKKDINSSGAGGGSN